MWSFMCLFYAQCCIVDVDDIHLSFCRAYDHVKLNIVKH